MTTSLRAAAALGLFLAAPSALAHEAAAAGGAGMLLLLLGVAVVALGLQAWSSARAYLLRNLRDGI